MCFIKGDQNDSHLTNTLCVYGYLVNECAQRKRKEVAKIGKVFLIRNYYRKEENNKK